MKKHFRLFVLEIKDMYYHMLSSYYYHNSLDCAKYDDLDGYEYYKNVVNGINKKRLANRNLKRSLIKD